MKHYRIFLLIYCMCAVQPSYAEVVPAPIPDLVENKTLVLPAVVSDQTAIPTNATSDFIEIGGNFSSVNDDLGDWNGQYIAGEIETDAANRWRGSYLHQDKFNEEGHYVTLGNVHIIDEDYYSDVTVGVGQGIIMNRYRIDAFLNRKWLDARNFVTTIGVGGSDSYSENSDVSLFLGGSYYFEQPWIVQGGVRVNRGTPGNIISPSTFAAITQGRNNEHFVTLRYGFGREAYQIIGPQNILSDFNSHTVSLNWKQWVRQSTETEKGWGFNATSEYYDNPNYNRTGLTLGVFREF